MSIHWKEFITTDFWFAVNREPFHLTDHLILYVGLGLIALAIIAAIYRFVTKNIFLKSVADQFFSVLITIGILESVWYLLRMQNVQAIGSRFASLFIAIIGLFWVYYPLKYLITRYKVDMADAQRKIMRDKYLAR